MKKLLITVLLMSACHQADYSADGGLSACPQGECAAGQDCLNGYCLPAATTGDPNPIDNDGGSGPSSDSGGGATPADSGVPARPEAGLGPEDSGSSSSCTVLSLGGEGYVDIVGNGDPDKYQIGTQFTLAARVWVASGHPAAMTIWDLESYVAQTPGDNTGVRLSLTDQALLLGYYGTPQGASTIISGASLSLDTWNHVTFVRNGRDVKLYINGDLDDTGSEENQSESAVTWEGSTADHDWYSLGRGRSTARPSLEFNDYFYGKMAAAGVWSRALSAAEVEELYEGHPMNVFQTGLKAYYPLDGQGDAASARDTESVDRASLVGNAQWVEDPHYPYCPG